MKKVKNKRKEMKRKSKRYTFPYNRSPIPGEIKDDVKVLIFDFDFNFPLEKESIPPTVREIIFGYRFNQPLSWNFSGRNQEN